MKRLKGFITDFWMLPLAIILTVKHNQVASWLKIMPTLNEVKVGNIVPTLVIFLLIMTIVRTYFLLQYNDVYNMFLMKKGGELWEKLSPWQQFLSLRLERWVLIIAAAIIYLAMF